MRSCCIPRFRVKLRELVCVDPEPTTFGGADNPNVVLCRDRLSDAPLIDRAVGHADLASED
jgi:hypothetical protein